MAYTDLLKAEGLSLFCEGFSFVKIRRQLKRRHPKECATLGLKTVKEWASKPDPEGLTWKERKAAYLREAQKSQGERIIDRYSQLTGLLDETITLIDERFREAASAHDMANPEYGAQVLLQLLSMRAKMLREGLMGETRIQGAEQLRVFFQVLAADDELGPVFERRRAYILREFQDQLAKKGLT